MHVSDCRVTAVVYGRIHCRERAVYTAVTGRTRPYRAVWERVHGPVGLLAMYTTGRVHGPYTRTLTEPCTWPVYTADYWPCTRPYIWRVHGLVTAVYTYACVHGREWAVYTAVSDRVDGRVRAVYRDAGRVHGSCAVCYYDFLCKRHLLCRNVQLQIHYIQKELGQLVLLAPRCGGQQYYVQCS